MDDTTVSISNAFDYSQGYTSPPSPPSAAKGDALPQSLDALSLEDNGSAAPKEGGDDDDVKRTISAPADAAARDDSEAPQRARPPVPKTQTPAQTQTQVHAAHLNPYHSTLPSNDLMPPTTLTPLRAHYLKKSLVNKQISYELNLITDPVLGANALGLLGSPFVLPDAAKQHVAAHLGDGIGTSGDLPFLRFMFHQFLLPFPFLASAPPSFWNAKVQPFLSNYLATTGVSQHTTMTEEDREVADSLLTKEERKEADDRRKMWVKVEKHLGLMIAVGIKLQGGEEVVRIGQSELRRIEMAAASKRKAWAEKHPMTADTIFFDVNVVGVRTITEKGRVRSKSHEVGCRGSSALTHQEFIIRTQRTGTPDLFVSRRYGDFRRLAEEVGTSHTQRSHISCASTFPRFSYRTHLRKTRLSPRRPHQARQTAGTRPITHCE